MNRKISLLCAFVFAASCAWHLPVAAQQLTRVTFPDRSGSIGLAPGWHIKSAGNGAVAAAGPGGSAITLGITVPCVTHDVARQFPDIPSNALFPGMPRVDFNDAVRAFVDMIQYTSHHSAVSVTNLKLKAVEKGEVENGHAAYIRYSATMNGKSVEVFGMYEILPVDQSSGMFYYSGVVADKGSYASQLPTMIKMWKSWSLSKETINKRLQDAADALAKVDVKGTVDAVMAERRRVAEKAAHDFQEYIRQ
jgi:hypothetical protein